MDTLWWTQSNPKILIEPTTKKFFGRYLYRLCVYAPGGRIIHSKRSVESEVDYRKSLQKNITYGWWARGRDIGNADAELLTIIKSIKQNPAHNLKLRVEEPRIQIYAETEQELQDLVKNYFGKFWQNIETITGPTDSAAEAVLNSGAIIRKTATGYRYKVIVRDGRYDANIRASILQYLDNLGPETVGYPKSLREMFSKESGYVWNCYFYTNDLTINSFLNIMAPGLISNFHELVVVADK